MKTNSIKLNEVYSLNVELGRLFIRFIILKNEQEYYCRKIRKSIFLKMLKSKEQQIFKGRIQLHRLNNYYKIIAKNETLGNVEIRKIIQMIDNQ